MIREGFERLYATWVYNFDRWAWKRRWRMIKMRHREFTDRFEHWYETGNWWYDRG